MIATWSVHDRPREQCMIATWSVHDHTRDHCMISHVISAWSQTEHVSEGWRLNVIGNKPTRQFTGDKVMLALVPVKGKYLEPMFWELPWFRGRPERPHKLINSRGEACFEDWGWFREFSAKRHHIPMFTCASYPVPLSQPPATSGRHQMECWSNFLDSNV